MPESYYAGQGQREAGNCSMESDDDDVAVF